VVAHEAPSSPYFQETVHEVRRIGLDEEDLKMNESS
jgi:hypothetical protein